MKAFLVVNPRAGRGLFKKSWENTVLPQIKKHLTNFSYAFTAAKGDGTRLTREALESGYNLIVSMGGDGTLNEVVNGFFEVKSIGDGKQACLVNAINPNAQLGILPFGSGGDFIRSLHFARDYKKCLAAFDTKKTLVSDVVLAQFDNKNISPRLFVNIADVGLVAAIMKRVNSKNRKIPSVVRYVTGTFQGFRDHKPVRVRLNLDARGATVVNLNNLLIANGEYFGSGMRPAPGAKIDDGLLDVVVLKDTKLKTFVTRFPMIYLRKKYGLAGITDRYQAKVVRVEPVDQSPLETEMDGETYGTGAVTFTLIPKAIKIKV